MDLITHAALSAATAASLARSGGLRAAAATGALAGLLPDADMLVGSSADPLLNLQFHRHFTHSLAFAPIGAALSAAIAWLAMRRRHAFAPLYGYACAGYLAALLLDACTSYGTHLLWPFATTPVAWSVISVIDPLFTLLVGIPLAFALSRRRIAPARLAVASAVAMIALGTLQHSRALEHAAQLAAARGHEPQRLLVKPTLGNLLLWRSLYLDEGRLFADAVRVSLPGRVRIYAGESAPRFDVRGEPALPEGSRARRDVERFVAFTDDWPVRHPRRVEVVGDARYAMLPTRIAPLWGVVIDAAAADAPVQFETLRESSVETLEQFFAMLLGRDLPAPSGEASRARALSPSTTVPY
ncbi:MAG: metal-dependent hydrolase [Burkholderiales bacterium]|nr:metal-dependent hydrolase [Burkholderiales bacterium]